MLKAAAERLRLRAAEKISADCSTGNLVVARADLTMMLDALDLTDGLMPPAILAKARHCRSDVREARYSGEILDEYEGLPSDIEKWVLWSRRAIDAAAGLVDAVMAYEHQGATAAPAPDATDGAAHQENAMTSNRDDVAVSQAEVNAKVQRAVDRNVAARQELSASNSELADIEADLIAGDAATLIFLQQYRNPTQPNPPPIAPDVAVPPPAEEPPVFTDVSTGAITPGDTSGGSSDVAASLPLEDFPEFTPDPPAPPADAPVGGGEGSGASSSDDEQQT